MVTTGPGLDGMGRESTTVVNMEPWSRPVPSTNAAPTVPSRRQNVSLPSNPAVKTCSYRPAPPFIAVTPSRQDDTTVKMP